MSTDRGAGNSSDLSIPTKTRRSVSDNAPKLPGDARPGLLKYRQTERPKATARASVLGHGIKRHATNTSLLNEAIWAIPPNSDDSATSTSDEDELQAEKDEERRGRRRGRTRKDSRGSYSRFNVGNDDFKTEGKVSKRDGRLNISVNETSKRGYLAKALGASFLKHLGPDVSHHIVCHCFVLLLLNRSPYLKVR